jgi:hypothetical protein
MRRNASLRHVFFGLLVGLVALPGSAQSLEKERTELPIPPEVVSPKFDTAEAKPLMTAGITLYVAGALYDLYTTKRAMDYGLHEANPILSRSGDPERTLATAAVAKVGFAFLIGRVGRGHGDRARGAWFLSCGALQLGLGIANRRATLRELESSYVAPAPQPLPPSDASAPAPTPVDEAAASRRTQIRK